MSGRRAQNKNAILQLFFIMIALFALSNERNGSLICLIVTGFSIDKLSFPPIITAKKLEKRTDSFVD